MKLFKHAHTVVDNSQNVLTKASYLVVQISVDEDDSFDLLVGLPSEPAVFLCSYDFCYETAPHIARDIIAINKLLPVYYSSGLNHVRLSTENVRKFTKALRQCVAQDIHEVASNMLEAELEQAVAAGQIH